MAEVKQRMPEWLRKLFRKRDVLGYHVYADVNGKVEDMGFYACSSDMAIEEAHMKIMERLFFGGSREMLFVNMRAKPVREPRWGKLKKL